MHRPLFLFTNQSLEAQDVYTKGAQQLQDTYNDNDDAYNPQDQIYNRGFDTQPCGQGISYQTTYYHY